MEQVTYRQYYKVLPEVKRFIKLAVWKGRLIILIKQGKQILWAVPWLLAKNRQGREMLGGGSK